MSSPTDHATAPRPIDAPPLPERAYSSGQVAGAAFLGGPLGGAILLASNCRLFGSRLSGSQIVSLGVLATFAALGISWVAPENTPNSLIPAIYTGIFQQISHRSHAARFNEFIAAGGLKYSHWRVFGIGLACLAVLLLMLVAIVLVVPEQYLSPDAA